MAHAATPEQETQTESAPRGGSTLSQPPTKKSPTDLQIDRVYRQVSNKKNHHVVVLEQTFTNPAHEIWKALTDPEALAVWLEPVEIVSGEDRRFKTGTTGTEGTIDVFDPPRLLQLSWENGDEIGELQISITQTAAGSSLTLRHNVPANDHWDRYGAGATGVGWDGSFLALQAFLSGRAATVRERMSALEGSEEGNRFIENSSKAWEQAQVKAGTDEDTARQQAERTRAFYTGQQEPQKA
ncbi:SRPBCC domain-containing protein [Curtobacterium sp. S6]|uniref:SRPBCC domain-containing protein n=1 Tax=Curtobacterium sp. S6 TaxID=1479623 RepID=UPI00068C71B1|nr:SRPBCC domain-containing protein [Curtobacterium sp. S6]